MEESLLHCSFLEDEKNVAPVDGECPGTCGWFKEGPRAVYRPSVPLPMAITVTASLGRKVRTVRFLRALLDLRMILQSGTLTVQTDSDSREKWGVLQRGDKVRCSACLCWSSQQTCVRSTDPVYSAVLVAS